MTTDEKQIKNNNEEVAKVENSKEQKQAAIKISLEQQEELKKYKEERGDKNLVGIVADMLTAYKDKEKLEVFSNVAVLEAAQGALDTLGKCFELLESNKESYVQFKLLEMQEKINTIEYKNKSLEEQLELKNKDILTVQGELRHFKQVANDKDVIIKEREEWLEEIKSQKEKTESEKNTLEEKLNERDFNFNTVFKELDKYRTLSETLEAKLENEIQSKKDIVNKTEAAVRDAFEEELTNLKMELESKNEQVTTLNAEMTKLNATLDAKEDTLNEIKRNNEAEIQKLKDKFEKEEGSLRERINSLELYKTNAENKINEIEEKDETINNLKADLKSMEDEFKKKMNGMKDEYNEDLKSYKDKVVSKVQEIEERDKTINNLKEEHKNEIKEYKDEVTGLKEELRKLKEEHRYEALKNKEYYEGVIKQKQEQIQTLLENNSDNI